MAVRLESRDEGGDLVGGGLDQAEVGFAALVGPAAALLPLLESARVESEALGEARAGEMGPGADGADVDRRMDNETLALACAKGGDLAFACCTSATVTQSTPPMSLRELRMAVAACAARVRLGEVDVTWPHETLARLVQHTQHRRACELR